MTQENINSRELIEQNLDYVRRLVYGMLGNVGLVDDLVQEIFVRVIRGYSTFKHESSFQTWVYRIATRVVYDHLDKQKAAPVLCLAEEEILVANQDASDHELLRLEREAAHDQVMNFPECWTIPDILFYHYLPMQRNLMSSMDQQRYSSFLKYNNEQWMEFKEQLGKSQRNDLLLLKDFLDYFDARRDIYYPPMGIRAPDPDANSRIALNQIEKMQRILRENNREPEAVTLKRNLDYAEKRSRETMEQMERLKQELAAIGEKNKGMRSEHLLKLPLVLPVEKEIRVDAKFSVVHEPQWTQGDDIKEFYPPKSRSRNALTFEDVFRTILVPEFHDSKYDIAWNYNNVFLCRLENGKLIRNRIFQRRAENDFYTYRNRDGISCVRSDGHWIWIVANYEVHCIDSDGKPIATFNTSCGLPNSEVLTEIRSRDYIYGRWNHEQYGNTLYEHKTLSIFPLGNGKAIACGQSNGKSWVAKLSVDERNQPQVDLLLNASRSMELKDIEKPGVTFDPKYNDLTFHVPWVLKMDDPIFPERRQILIGRELRDEYPAPPFLLDLDTWKIMPVTERYPDLKELVGFDDLKYANCHFVGIKRSGFYTFDRDVNGNYQIAQHTIKNKIGARQRYFRYYWNLIQDGNKIYLNGFEWYEFDCSNDHNPLVPKRIADMIVPDTFCFRRFVKTANFGLCAMYSMEYYNRAPVFTGELYRFDFTTPTQAVFSPYTRYVPDEALARHCNAVKELEAHGAIITGRVNNKALQNDTGYFVVPTSGDDPTYVVLDKSWTGTAKDFEKILDLYPPSKIYFYDLTLTDDYFRVLGNTDAQAVYFINAGIRSEQFQLINPARLGLLYFLYDEGKGPDDSLVSILLHSDYKGQLQVSPHLFSKESRELTIPSNNSFFIINANPETWTE